MYVLMGLFYTIGNGDAQINSDMEDIPATSAGSTKRDDPGGGLSSSFPLVSPETPLGPPPKKLEDNDPGIGFSSPLKNYTRFAGENLRLICEAKGYPPPLRILWFKDHLPLEKQAGRIKIRHKVGSGSSMRSTVRIRNLETMDKGIYRCDATNVVDTISSESLVQVHPKKLKNWDRQRNNYNKHQQVCNIFELFLNIFNL